MVQCVVETQLRNHLSVLPRDFPYDNEDPRCNKGECDREEKEEDSHAGPDEFRVRRHQIRHTCGEKKQQGDSPRANHQEHHPLLGHEQRVFHWFDDGEVPVQGQSAQVGHGCVAEEQANEERNEQRRLLVAGLGQLAEDKPGRVHGPDTEIRQRERQHEPVGGGSEVFLGWYQVDDESITSHDEQSHEEAEHQDPERPHFSCEADPDVQLVHFKGRFPDVPYRTNRPHCLIYCSPSVSMAGLKLAHVAVVPTTFLVLPANP